MATEIDEKDIDKLGSEISAHFSMPLVTASDPMSVHKLREQIANAQAFAIRIADASRRLKIRRSQEASKAWKVLKDKEEYQKAKVADKEMMISEYIGGIDVDVKYLNSLEEIVEKRCSIGQSLLKSLSLEGEAMKPNPQSNQIPIDRKPEF